VNASHRILVCGVGSVGERHIRNLSTLGYHHIAVYRARNLPFRDLNFSIPIYTDLKEALTDFAPSVTFITNPTALHVPMAMEAARANSHLFIEKPISHNLEGIEELCRMLESNHRMAMVGYMLRFHPFFKQLKAWLNEGPSGVLGRPIFLRTTWGEHLPDWHPWEDYRQSYAACADMGGGPALTLSHDIDLLVWLFGAPDNVVGLPNSTSPLNINVEHSIDILLGFSQGVTANVHLDFCQRPPSRVWELVCSHGQVRLDILAGTLTRWESTIGEIHTPQHGPITPVDVQTLPENFDRNDLFLEELRYFFLCLNTGERPMPDISIAAESVRIAQRALSKGLT
jgi:predicted dehydrogenase